MDKEPSPDPPESEAVPPGLSRPSGSQQAGFTSSWAELKRRKGVRMAITGTVLTVSILTGTRCFSEPDPANVNQKTLNAEELEYIVQNNVLNFLRLMEDLTEDQVDPLADEMSVFFRELALIVQAIKSLGPDEPNQKRKLRKLNGQVASLRSQTRKNVKGILERKQYRRYNLLIDEIAPLPSLIPNELYDNQPAWEQSDYHLEYPRQQNLKNK